jgi:hypothetical protein
MKFKAAAVPQPPAPPLNCPRCFRSHSGPKLPALSMYSDPPSRIDERVLEPAHQPIPDLQIEADAMKTRAGDLDGHVPRADSARNPSRRRKSAHHSSRQLPRGGPPASSPLIGKASRKLLRSIRPNFTPYGGRRASSPRLSRKCLVLSLVSSLLQHPDRIFTSSLSLVVDQVGCSSPTICNLLGATTSCSRSLQGALASWRSGSFAALPRFRQPIRSTSALLGSPS